MTQKPLPFSDPIDFTVIGEIKAHQKALLEVKNPAMLRFVREEGQQHLGEVLLHLYKLTQSLPQNQATTLLLKEFGLE